MNGTIESKSDEIERTRLEALLGESGFFCEPGEWNRSLAERLARLDGLSKLTAEHWQVIDALREHHKQFGAAPPAFSHICAQLQLGSHCVEHLFGSNREAWRIAGLPDPGEEAKAYL